MSAQQKFAADLEVLIARHGIIISDNQVIATLEEALSRAWGFAGEPQPTTLFAAAPDMIMALIWLVGLKDERPADYAEQKPLAWAAARAAILKATGGAS